MNFGILYGLALLVSVVIQILVADSKTKYSLLFSDVIIAIPAMLVKPWGDAIRFANILDIERSFNNMGLKNGLTWGLQNSPYSSQPVVATYIWLFSLCKNNGIFFYITTLLFLLLISTLILMALSAQNVSQKKAAVLTQLIVLMIFNTFFEVEGIRNFLAFALIAVALYIDFNTENKKIKFICLLLYLLSYSFHPATLPFILIRFIFYFKNKFLIFLTALFSLIYTFFISKITKIFSNIDPMLESKGQTYLYGQSNYNAYAANIEIVVTTLVLLYLIYELFIYVYFTLNKESISHNYLMYYYVAILFTIGSFLSTQVYLRSIMLILFLSIPVKVKLFSDVDISSVTVSKVLYMGTSFILAISMFIYWYWAYYQWVIM